MRKPIVSVWDETQALQQGYLRMAANEEREKTALEWCNALIGDIPVPSLGEAMQDDEIL